MAGASDKAPKKVDMVAQKRVQYGRVLYPPQEKGFNPDAWIAKIESPDMTRGEFGLIEDLLDARSRLYSAAERLRCRPTRDAQGEELAARGYDALNRMDLSAATNACAALEARLGDSGRWMPYASFNPFNWVKCFTQWGYMRAADGCSVSEPNPWLVMWQDGFRMNLAQDARVVAANTAANPSIDVDGVETLTLSGFPSEPQRLRWIGVSGGTASVQLVNIPPAEPEIVASALMDFKTPPPKQRGWARGVQNIDPAKVDRPYLWLVGDGWSLALFPGARPVSAVWEKGVFSLKLERRSWVGVMRLRDNLHDWEQPEVCEFFAPTALAYPTSCRSEVNGSRASWKYGHRMRANAWGTVPHVIAPVPPLLDYADVPVPGSKHFKYPTKWGIFRYCEGNEAVCELPPLPREPRLRGVNVGIWDSDELWEAHAKVPRRSALQVLPGEMGQLPDSLERRGVRGDVGPHLARRREARGGDRRIRPLQRARACGRIRGALAPPLRTRRPRHPPKPSRREDLLSGDLRRQSERALQPVAAIRGLRAAGDHLPLLLAARLLAPEDQHAQRRRRHVRVLPRLVRAGRLEGRHALRRHDGGLVRPLDARRHPAACVRTLRRAPQAASRGRVFNRGLRQPEVAVERLPLDARCDGTHWSAYLWTRDATELIESNGASWHLWNGGFGLGNRHVRPYIYGLWKEPSPSAPH